MKKWSVFLCALIIVLAQAALANATLISVSDTIDWDEMIKEDRTAIRIFDNDPTFTYQHAITFDSGVSSVDTATLTLSHYGNNLNKEAWLLSDDGTAIPLGALCDSDRVWVDQSFDLKDLVPVLSKSTTWILQLRLTESSGDPSTDNIYLDKSVLEVTYDGSPPVPVPEPATMLLLGSGLIGLTTFGRKKLFKK